jgi:hypothetical protein
MTEQHNSFIVEGWDLPLSVDQVVWSQGADPAVMRRRRPLVMRIAEEVMAQEVQHLAPQLLYRRIPVTGFRHNRLELAGGQALRGDVLAEHLAAAEEVIMAIYTIGAALDERLEQTMRERLPYALALDALGTAAVDELGRQVQAHFKALGQADGRQVSMCYSPGMLGWPLEVGQPQVFALLDAQRIGVSVADTGRMTPRKTVSAVFGLGSRLSEEQVSPCEFCAVQENCQYRGRHGEYAAIQD